MGSGVSISVSMIKFMAKESEKFYYLFAFIGQGMQVTLLNATWLNFANKGFYYRAYLVKTYGDKSIILRIFKKDEVGIDQAF